MKRSSSYCFGNLNSEHELLGFLNARKNLRKNQKDIKSVPVDTIDAKFAFEKIRKVNKNTIILGIGANMKNPPKTFALLFRLLKKNSKIKALKSSLLYKNPAFGMASFSAAPFYNAIFMLQTSLSPRELYALLFYLERRFGRARKRIGVQSRELDIDIILYKNLRRNYASLCIPHPRAHKRLSVIIPLISARK